MKQQITHHELCIKAAKFIHTPGHVFPPTCTYIAIDLVTLNPEVVDVFGWNSSWETILIKVKVSRSDFLRDLKKPFRIRPETGIGNLRYYCCPEGIIKENDIPELWGLMYLIGDKIKVIKRAECQFCNKASELTILTSIMRREGIKPQIFNYKK